mmetsp:Transcript_8716/g.15293  ORF Transcript_8716/g.15293 Transcript_8716/m.15293 type:complete len:282 (-) Transcript_8716:641-1486(-)
MMLCIDEPLLSKFGGKDQGRTKKKGKKSKRVKRKRNTRMERGACAIYSLCFRFRVVLFVLLTILQLLLGVVVFCKGLCHDKRKDKGHFSVELDRLSVYTDLAPRNSLIRPCTRVTSIKLVRGIDEHRKVSAIAHQVGVAHMVLDEPTSKNNHTGLLREQCCIVNGANVTCDVNHEPGFAVRMKVDHISNATIRESGAEHRDVILVRPIVHRAGIVDFLTEPMDHRAWRPNLAFVALLIHHLIENGVHPVFKLAVVAVGDKKVPNTVETLQAKLATRKSKVT